MIMGLFLGISGASKRVLSVRNHMGVSVSYEYVLGFPTFGTFSQRISSVESSLTQLMESSKDRAREFVRSGVQLWCIVYDNINFTL